MSYWYLATPYSKYPAGVEAAFQDAAREASRLLAAGVPVFCPITHSHPMVPYIPMNQDNHETWLGLDRVFMDAAIGLIVCQLESWETSYGVQYEINYMRSRSKPVLWMSPGVIPGVLLDSTSRYHKPNNYDLARQSVPPAYV